MEAKISGCYQHYKGNEYRVLAIGKHTETGEDMVVYQSLIKPSEVWIRPRGMFEETLEKDGKTIHRFKRYSI
jgi:hypothetical protein